MSTLNKYKVIYSDDPSRLAGGEKLDKVSAYTEYVAETVNKNLIMEDRAEDISKADMARGQEHPTELGKAILKSTVVDPNLSDATVGGPNAFSSTIKASIQEDWNNSEIEVEITEKEETNEAEEDRAEDIEKDINDLGKTKELEDKKELQTEKKSKSQDDKQLKEEEEENEEPEVASDEEVSANTETADTPVGEDVEVEESEEDDTEVEESDDEDVDEALSADAGDKAHGTEATDLGNDSKDITKETPEMFHGDEIDDKTIVVKDKEVLDGANAGEVGGKAVLDKNDKTEMMDAGESPLDEDRAEDIEDEINAMGTPKSLEGEEELQAENEDADFELDVISEEEEALNQYKDEVESKLSAIIESNNKKPSTEPSFFYFVNESVKEDFNKLNEEEQEKVLSAVEGKGFLSEGQIMNLWSTALVAPVEEELNVLKLMPAEYKEAWGKLSESKKSSLLLQSQYHRTDTTYQVRNFWQTRDLREDKQQKVMEKLIVENESTTVVETPNSLPYDLEDMKSLITERFKYKK